MSNLQIPNFPEFKTLGLEDSDTIRTIISRYPTYSDFGFTSLLCWDTKEEIEISILNGNLVVIFQDYVDGNKFFSLLGSTNIDETLSKLIAFSDDRKYGSQLKLVPQTVVDNIRDPSAFIIEEDRDNFDYILGVRFQAELAGGKNEDRRYRINKFLKSYGEKTKVSILELKEINVQKQVIECLEQWGESHGKKNAEVILEQNAIKRLLKFAEALPVQGVGIYIDDTLCAFSIFEIIHSDSSVIHFEKCDLKYDGISHFIRHEVAKKVHEHKRIYINYEQDLGIEGLRRSKEMLHPDHFLKKYTVSLAKK